MSQRDGSVIIVRRFFFILLLSCLSDLNAQTIARAGLLDLTPYDPKSFEITKLDGQWQFVWHEFTPADAGSLQQTTFANFPGPWNEIKRDGKALPPDGFATYRLRIVFNPLIKRVSFHVPIMGTSYRLFFNDQLIASNGVPGETASSTRPDFLPLITTSVAVPESSQANLTLHIANFHDRSGGPWFPIRIGTERAIRSFRENQIARDLILTGALSIMGLYHLGIFAVRRKDRLPLFFGLFCLVMAFRSMSEGEKFLLTILPGLSWTWAVRLSYVSFYLGIPLFLSYFTALFPDEASSKFIKVLTAPLVLLSVFVFFTPVRIFSETLPYVHALTIVLAIYCLVVNVRAVIHRRAGARLFVLGLSLFGTAIVNDILVGYSMTPWATVFAPLGVLLFVFAQAYLLSNRFSKAFLEAETLSRDLDTANNHLERRIEERNKELRDKLQLIRRDL